MEMLAVGRKNLLPEDEDLRPMGDECIAYRLGPQADKRGRVLQAAEPCRATGARKTYWKTLMATMAGCCTPTMATDVQAMEQPTHDSQRLIRVQRTVSADIKPVADVLMGWRKVAGGIIKHGPAPRSSAEHAVGAALRAVRS
mmetsp:Transcript_4791/g.7412  ORF Transcript_4791/g.7412 Transcript_4791/m.7412 type:complete len:142 (+) Transcript_4791:367-792(+)